MKRFFADRVKTSPIKNCNHATDVSPGNDFVYIRPPTPIISSFITLLSFNTFGIRPRLPSGNAKHKIKLFKADVASSRFKTVLSIFKIEASQTKIVSSQPKIEASQAKIVSSQPKIEASQAKIVSSQSKIEASQAKIEASQPKIVSSQSKIEASQAKIVSSIFKIEPSQPAVVSSSPALSLITYGLQSLSFAMNETTNKIVSLLNSKHYAKIMESGAAHNQCTAI